MYYAAIVILLLPVILSPLVGHWLALTDARDREAHRTQAWEARKDA